MSYSRQTGRASLGRVPEPEVPLAIVARGAEEAGINAPPLDEVAVPPPAPGARQTAPEVAVESFGGGPAGWARANSTSPMASSTSAADRFQFNIIPSLRAQSDSANVSNAISARCGEYRRR